MPRLPKPFKRPGIAISDGSPEKTWREIQVQDVNTGDLVAGVGLVDRIEKYEDPYQINLINVFDVRHVLSPRSLVNVFRVHMGDGHQAAEDVLRG